MSKTFTAAVSQSMQRICDRKHSIKLMGECLVDFRQQGRGQALFYGPYWFLKAGRYRLKIHGEVEGALVVTIVQRPGHALTQFSLPNGVKEANFAIDQDAVKFQCVARAGVGSCSRFNRAS